MVFYLLFSLPLLGVDTEQHSQLTQLQLQPCFRYLRTAAMMYFIPLVDSES